MILSANFLRRSFIWRVILRVWRFLNSSQNGAGLEIGCSSHHWQCILGLAKPAFSDPWGLERLIWLDTPSHISMWNSRKICIITIIAALCVGSNYALVGVPNVKIMDLLVFISGFIFGPVAGASVGVFAWFIYGLINPYGFVFQIWLATMFSEVIYGVAGGAIGKWLVSTSFAGNPFELSFLFGAAGFLSTFVYDLTTNVVYAWASNVPLLVAMIAGVPFALVHEVSNAVLFGVCTVPLIKTLEKFVGGESFWRRQKIDGS